MLNHSKIYRTLTVFLVASLACASCRKFVEVPPPKTQLTGATVFTDDGTATSAITGIYNRMFNGSGFASGGISSVSFLAGLSADEFFNHYPGEPEQFYQNDIVPGNLTLYYSVWNEAYQYIYTANAVLEGLERSSSVSEAVRSRLTGEAKFVRAFCYFYLVNLFGEVPLALSTDYLKNSIAERSAVAEVYALIEEDLKSAAELLGTEYVDGKNISSAERVRPNRYAASALLARVYFFAGKWSEAAAEASRVIDSSGMYSLASLADAFLKNSGEAIWQLFPAAQYMNAMDGTIYIVSPGSVPFSASLSMPLLDAFETGDNRLTEWVGTVTTNSVTYHFPYKYKKSFDFAVTEYSTILRLAEQYLIRAEAKANLDDFDGAVDDLNAVRVRAGLLPIAPITDRDDLLEAILRERRVELFSEWGHRWLDLKRTGNADAVMTVVKPQSWQHTDKLYPIPQSDILANSNLEQNPGY